MLTPTIEIVAIGNELLKGMTVNTNAAEIGSALRTAGYRCQRQIVLPDEKSQLKQELEECLQKSRIVIATGGLGPTCDDITRQVAAELFDSGFTLDETLAADLIKRYGNIPISLQDQATVPTKATILKNPLGTAPGLAFSDEKRTLILMPGVPQEMRFILKEHVIPYLLKHFPLTSALHNASANFFSLSESAVDPILRELEIRYPSIEFGIYPSQGTLSVHATIASDQKNQAQSLVNAAIDELKQRFSDRYYEASTGKIEEAIQALFIKNEWTLSTAESCTGGAIAAKLTRVAGASNYFIGSIVAYSNQVKESILRVPKEIIETHGAVSEETVSAMASAVVQLTGSDFGISITGIAGPSGGTPEKPVGTVWIAVVRKGQKPKCILTHARGNREINIERSVNVALGLLLTYCKQ